MNSLMRRPLLGLSTFDDSLFDRFFDDLFESFQTPSTFITTPSTDIFYTDDDKVLRIDMEVPGYDREDVEMSVDNNVLEIRGKRSDKTTEEDQGRKYAVRERNASFVRRVVLPDGADSEKIAAEMENGILSVTVPVDRPEARRIAISAPKNQRKAKLASLTGSKPEAK